jgi:phospholipase C
VTGSTTNPYGVAATPDGSQVWVTESGTNTVSVIPTSTNKITDTVVVGVYPHGIAISPDGKTAYVANTGPNTGRGGSQTVSVVDVNALRQTKTIKVGEAPQVVDISPDGSQLWVTCADGVFVITTAGGHVRKASEPLHNPHGVTVAPNGKHAYVTDTEHDQVVVISTSSLRTVRRVKVGRSPWNTAFTADSAKAFVSNANENTVSAIDTARGRVVKTIALGSGSDGQLNHIPTGIALSPEGHIWVACNVSSSIVVIDPSSDAVLQSIDIGLGDGPTEIAFAA